ncbi:hypothetical protein EDB86DRAFT_1273410 [Lactarius hatsudake]|nr:hypothetical protein EDB86DRAFT_1273410 [Lactarius hatsudake]
MFLNLPNSASHTISRSTYSSPHPCPHPSRTSRDDPTCHAHFLHTASGSSSARQSFSSHQPLHQPPISLNRHLSEPNIRVDTQQSSHNYTLPNRDRTMLSTGTEATSQFPACHFTLAEFCDPSLGWDRWDVRAEPIQDVTPVKGAHTSLHCDPRRSS